MVIEANTTKRIFNLFMRKAIAKYYIKRKLRFFLFDWLRFLSYTYTRFGFLVVLKKEMCIFG